MIDITLMDVVYTLSMLFVIFYGALFLTKLLPGGGESEPLQEDDTLVDKESIKEKEKNEKV